MLKSAVNSKKKLQAALIIDGAYLMISANIHAKHLLPLFQSSEGVAEFENRLSTGFVKMLKTIPQDQLSPNIYNKVSEAPAVNGATFESKHLLYAMTESNTGQKYSPEGVVREAWRDFSIRENLHKYKEHGVKCSKCGYMNIKKVQAGVDVGVAVRICEILLESSYSSGSVDQQNKKNDAIILIAGDRDFKDVMDLCMKYFPNLFLIGFRENTQEIIMKHCVGFFDMRDVLLIQEKPVSLQTPCPNRNCVVGVHGLTNTIDQTTFCELLQSNGVTPGKVKWQQDMYHPENSYVLLFCSSKEEADKALNFVKNRIILILIRLIIQLVETVALDY